MAIVKEILESNLERKQQIFGIKLKKAETIGEMQHQMIEAINSKVKIGEKKNIKHLNTIIRT